MAQPKDPTGSGDKASMRIDPSLVRELAQLLTDNELTEIEVEDGDRRIKVKREPATVAGTAAVQWYVAESDIAMYPSIGDISLNRITRTVMENAANAVAIAARNWAERRAATSAHAPLVAVSSFGGTAACVERVGRRLEALGYEVILFHASGAGGRSLGRPGSTLDMGGAWLLGISLGVFTGGAGAPG